MREFLNITSNRLNMAMGDFNLNSNESDNQNEYSLISKVTVVLLVLLGLIAPVWFIFSSYFGNHEILLQSLMWAYVQSNYGTYFEFHFYYWYIISMFPLMILRLVPASQIFRYYQAKTSRRRTIIAVLLGDIYFVLDSLLMLFINLGSLFTYLIIPLPFQMLVGLTILWRYPIPEPTAPWDDEVVRISSEETKNEDHLEKVKPDNDKDKLW